MANQMGGGKGFGPKPPTGPTWEDVFVSRLLQTPKIQGGVSNNWVKVNLWGISNSHIWAQTFGTGRPSVKDWTGGKTPEAVNMAWDNAETFNDVWGNYPWPGEAWIFIKTLHEFHGGPINTIVYGDRRITKDDAKFWTSATMGADYPRLADRANAILQKEIRQDKRRAMTQAFGIAAVGLLLGGVLTGGALSLANKGIDQLKAHQKKELAKGFKSLADGLRDGAPAFAAEMDRMAGIFGPEVFLEPPGPVLPAPPPAPPAATGPADPGKKETAPNGLLVLWGRFVQWIDDVLT